MQHATKLSYSNGSKQKWIIHINTAARLIHMTAVCLLECHEGICAASRKAWRPSTKRSWLMRAKLSNMDSFARKQPWWNSSRQKCWNLKSEIKLTRQCQLRCYQCVRNEAKGRPSLLLILWAIPFCWGKAYQLLRIPLIFVLAASSNSETKQHFWK